MKATRKGSMYVLEGNHGRMIATRVELMQLGEIIQVLDTKEKPGIRDSDLIREIDSKLTQLNIRMDQHDCQHYKDETPRIAAVLWESHEATMSNSHAIISRLEKLEKAPIPYIATKERFDRIEGRMIMLEKRMNK